MVLGRNDAMVLSKGLLELISPRENFPGGQLSLERISSSQEKYRGTCPGGRSREFSFPRTTIDNILHTFGMENFPVDVLG